jgi:hypothetical protein
MGVRVVLFAGWRQPAKSTTYFLSPQDFPKTPFLFADAEYL